MPPLDRVRCLTCLLLLLVGSASALESDRQQPLLVDADSTEGTLGDGKATLSGNVVIQQGSLLVKADVAEVEKVEGRVRSVLLTGSPVLLQQEIEEQGLVSATAQRITYQVATGMVTLEGAADVNHPQYHISGEQLSYDMNRQHFQGSSGEGNSRIRIELAPEVVPGLDAATSGGSDEGGESANPESEPAAAAAAAADDAEG